MGRRIGNSLHETCYMATKIRLYGPSSKNTRSGSWKRREREIEVERERDAICTTVCRLPCSKIHQNSSSCGSIYWYENQILVPPLQKLSFSLFAIFRHVRYFTFFFFLCLFFTLLILSLFSFYIRPKGRTAERIYNKYNENT